MQKYKIQTKLYSDIIIYKNDVEFLKLERSNGFFKTKSKISSKGELVLQYNYFTFLCFTSLKIILNKFSSKFTIKKKICSLFIIIDNNQVTIKYSLHPFNKTFGKIMFNHKPIGKITQQPMDLSYTSYILLDDSFEKYDLYILILLLIELTHIDSE